ncbi:hypothetical protein NXX19_27855 [Bacteroides ovatus]|nr:hypothetical protein [Bacteroides ovatus]
MLLLSPENRSESNPYFHLGDNMVLQQQSEVTFSGTATSGKRVQATASWNNKKIQTNVDAKGEWKLSLQTPVAGYPYSITFSDGEGPHCRIF